MANQYDVGDKPKITGTFKQDGVVGDPAAVVAKFKDPSGSTTTYTYGTDAELVRASAGVYYFYIDIDEAGFWYYRMSDNDENVATEGYFVVRQSSI